MSEDGDDEPSLPSFITENLDLLRRFLTNPGKFIRGFIFGSLLAGFGNILAEVFNVMQLLVLGSKPGEFGAPGETWGIADVPVVIGGVVGDTAGAVVLLLFDTYADILRALIPDVGSPVVVPLAAVALVFTGVVIFRLVGPALLTTIQALLEAIPFVGGPLSTILGRLRS